MTRALSALRPCTLSIIAACLSLADAHAQSAPDAGSLLRDSQQNLPRLPTPALPKQAPPALLKDPGVKVTVTRFIVEGAQRYDAATLEAVLADQVGQALGFSQLQAAADRVAAYYRTRGIHATAYLPEQTLTSGTVRIVVVEGRFGKLRPDTSSAGPRKLPVALVSDMLARGQTSGELLDTRALERATIVANEVPGVRVSSLLTAGDAPGETDIVARIDDRPLFAGLGSIDNFDPRATGRTKATVAVGIANPTGFGDQIQLLANGSQGKQYGRVAYDIPLGASGLRGGVNGSAMHYKLIDAFAASDARGSARTYGGMLTYPILRSDASNLFATASYEHRHLVNDTTFGNLSDKTDDAGTFTINGDATDGFGGGGAFVGSLAVTFGSIDLSGNPLDLATDRAGPNRDGRFLKYNASLARLQRLSERGAFWLSLSGQYANGNLDSGEQISLGGPYGVRAYPSLEGTGDHGFIATAEYRYRVLDGVQTSVFYDFGAVTREQRPTAGSVLEHYNLKGAGIAAEWTVQNVATVRATVATRIGHNPAALPTGKDSDGSKRQPQFWLSLNVPF